MSTQSRGLKRVRITAGIYPGTPDLRSCKRSTTSRWGKRRLSRARRQPVHHRAFLPKVLSPPKSNRQRAGRQPAAAHCQAPLSQPISGRKLKPCRAHRPTAHYRAPLLMRLSRAKSNRYRARRPAVHYPVLPFQPISRLKVNSCRAHRQASHCRALLLNYYRGPSSTGIESGDGQRQRITEHCGSSWYPSATSTRIQRNNRQRATEPSNSRPKRL